MNPVLMNEIGELLLDIHKHKFTQSRQINPESALYQAAKAGLDQGYLTDGYLDDTYSKTLASIDMTQAIITAKGQQLLTTYQQSKEQTNGN